jgi:putative transposase
MLGRAKEICANIAESFEMELQQFSGSSRHIHLVVEAPPGAPLARFANSVKTVTARLLRKEYGEALTRKLESGLWEESYALRTKSHGRTGMEEYLGRKRSK